MSAFRRRNHRIHTEIHPDEILADATNIPEFDQDQFEGRLERPLNPRSVFMAGIALAIVFSLLLFRAVELQVVRGTQYAQQARNNLLAEKVVFADRGSIADRNGILLAYNERNSIEEDFSKRRYAPVRGIAHVVGYVKPPAKDSLGTYFRNEWTGMDGAEKAFNTELGGHNGIKLSETDAHNTVVSESVVEPAEAGQKITLSIDASVTQGLYDAIKSKVDASNFKGGAGILMDVTTGEILAFTSYPEYSQNALQNGDAAVLKQMGEDKRQPYLDRVTNGLYAPGSIVKPVVGAAALAEGVITEDKQILSTGSISVPNQYDPAHPSVFRDWRVNGWVDVRQAIAVSCDVYFYEVGGGF